MLEKISFLNEVSKVGSIITGFYNNGELCDSGKALDKQILDGELQRVLDKACSNSSKRFEVFKQISSNNMYKYVALINLGAKDEKFVPFDVEKLGAKIYSAMSGFDKKIIVAIDSKDIHVPCPCAPAMIAFGSILKSWKFDKYKTKRDNKEEVLECDFIVSDVKSATDAYAKLRNIADGIILTRSVVSEPANVIYPESLAQIAQKELEPLGVQVDILGVPEMQKLGMNALLGVGQGSEKEPRLVVLHWKGNSEAPVAIVGKGITFDSGGISIKPDDGMDEMKCDMAGSGTVLGLLKSVALNKLPINLVGVMALAENMPSGSAQRPGDIVKTMSGQTVEILSTDAEGRLVLADALWYAQDKFKPQAMIDLATLTGAIVVALGHEFAGLFSNNDNLADKIIKSANVTGEKVWRMPITEHFERGVDSDIADIRNLGKKGIRAGSITAATFLKRFVNDVAWAHIDIAGVESSTNDLFICNGATGFGVHLLYDLLETNYVK